MKSNLNPNKVFSYAKLAHLNPNKIFSYAKLALEHKYTVEFVEPITEWKFDVKTLAARNTHGVNLVSERQCACCDSSVWSHTRDAAFHTQLRTHTHTHTRVHTYMHFDTKRCTFMCEH